MQNKDDETHTSATMTQMVADTVDLDIVDAIQLQPRAGWADISRLVGVSEATVSRRWARLREQGLAWSGVALHPRLSVGAFLEIRCWTDDHDRLLVQLARHPDVITIGITTGDFNIFAIVIGISLQAVLRRVYEELPELKLADRVRVSLFHQIAGGVGWRQGLLKIPAPSPGLEYKPQVARAQGNTNQVPPPESARALILELARDARMPVRELARRVKTTPGVVTRQLRQLVNDSSIQFRCDVARPDFDYQVGMLVLLKVPVLAAQTITEEVGTWVETRFCAAVASTANLIVVAGLRDLQDGDRFLSELAHLDQGATVLDCRIVTRNEKVYGWHLDSAGRATACTPVDPWTMSDLSEAER